MAADVREDMGLQATLADGADVGQGNPGEGSLGAEDVQSIRGKAFRRVDKALQRGLLEAGDQHLFVRGRGHLVEVFEGFPFQTISRLLYH